MQEVRDIADSPTFEGSNNEALAIETYFKSYDTLLKSEKWEEIISQGRVALEALEKANRPQDEAKICAQLASASFKLGNFEQALSYVNCCKRLSIDFEDPFFLIQALYLESAVHRALAAKEEGESAQQAFYHKAVELCEEADSIYAKRNAANANLKGKIYFNWGAAHADNPSGDLEKAANCYSTALECFKEARAADEIMRTNVRLGKIYLLQKNYDLVQAIVDEVRSQNSSELIAMHADYLEAQLKYALGDSENAIKIARNGLSRAHGAKEDELRFITFLNTLVRDK